MSTQQYASKLACLRHDRVLAVVESLNILPSAVNVPMRIMELYRNPKMPPIDQFAEVIIADASLSAKLLELANSSWFSPTRAVTRVSDALRMIGLKNVMPLLFGVSLAGVFNKVKISAEEREALWTTSIYKAVAAREWTRRMGFEQGEEAFLAALLQDIALPAIFASDRAASFELAGILDLDPEIRSSREFDLYAADHAEFGRLIAMRLKLPEFFIAATGSHHDPDGPKLPEEFEAIAPALTLAAALPHGMSRIDDQATRRVRACFKNSAKPLSDKEVTLFLQRVGEGVKSLNSMLGPVSGADLKGFLQQAADQITSGVIDAIGAASKSIAQMQSLDEKSF